MQQEAYLDTGELYTGKIIWKREDDSDWSEFWGVKRFDKRVSRVAYSQSGEYLYDENGEFLK